MVVVSPTRRRQARLLGAHYLARINSSIAIVVAPRLTKHSLHCNHCSDLPVLTVRSSTIALLAPLQMRKLGLGEGTLVQDHTAWKCWSLDLMSGFSGAPKLYL